MNAAKALLVSVHTPPPPRVELKWIGVDLDGTLFQNNWSPDNPTAGVGLPIERNVDKLVELVCAGYKAVIHTARPWADYEMIEAALLHYGIPFKSIVCGKLLAVAYVDDRAVEADAPSWLDAVHSIEESH